MVSMLVSLEEVVLVRGSLLHIDEAEAVLLQLLRHLLPYQGKGHFFSPIFFFFLMKIE